LVIKMYKQYQFKTSLSRSKSRMVQGGTSTVIGDKISWIERRDISAIGDSNDISVVLDITTVYRLDRLAFKYYRNSELEWVILQYNDIVDVSDLSIGDVIRIPSNAYVNTMILNKSAML